jgi:hypothetical protein
MDDVQLSVLPTTISYQSMVQVKQRLNGGAPNTKQKTKDIRLLFLVQLANVLIRTHPVGWWVSTSAAPSTSP